MDLQTPRGCVSRRRVLSVLAVGAVTLACGDAGDSVTETVTVAASTESPTTPAGPAVTAGVLTPKPVTPSPVTQSPAAPDPDAALRRLDGYGFQAHLYNQDRDFVVGKTLEAGFNWRGGLGRVRVTRWGPRA